MPKIEGSHGRLCVPNGRRQSSRPERQGLPERYAGDISLGADCLAASSLPPIVATTIPEMEAIASRLQRCQQHEPATSLGQENNTERGINSKPFGLPN